MLMDISYIVYDSAAAKGAEKALALKSGITSSQQPDSNLPD